MKTFYEYVYERDLLEAESPKKKILKKAALAVRKLFSSVYGSS